MKKQHTPTDNAKKVVTVKSNKTVKIVNKASGEFCETTPDNIVKCVNLHDELIKLVEMYKNDMKVNNYSWVKMQQIDDALKRAKGGE